MSELFNTLTKPLIGMPVSHVWRGLHSAIFIEFGELSKNEQKRNPKGEYSLMLDCGWRIEKPKSIWIGSYITGKRRIDNQIKKINGNIVTRIETIGYLPEIVISLTPTARIVSFTIYGTQPNWSLCLPDGYWLSCKRGIIVKTK